MYIYLSDQYIPLIHQIPIKSHKAAMKSPVIPMISMLGSMAHHRTLGSQLAETRDCCGSGLRPIWAIEKHQHVELKHQNTGFKMISPKRSMD